MNRSAPVDTLPEFEGLSLQASALMIRARSHMAKGEPFDAAVDWVKAGHSSANLAAELLRAGFAAQAAEDLLNAANCFLGAGDHRLADVVLEQFRQHAQLRDLLDEDAFLAQEHAATTRRCDQRRRELERAREELRQQMGEPDAVHRLSDAWLNDVLARMPGVPDLHWFAARKASRKHDSERAITHFTWCLRLKPDSVAYWFLCISELRVAKRFDEAVAMADEALPHFPNIAVMAWIAGWARIERVIAGRGPKSSLALAHDYLLQALKLRQLTELQTVATLCLIHLCLKRLGHVEEATDTLKNAIRDYPVSTSEMAWRLLRARDRRVEHELLAAIPGIFMSAMAA